MKRFVFSPLLLAALATLGCGGGSPTAPRTPSAPGYTVNPATKRSGFGFNGTVVSATGETISLVGGGSFDPATGSNVIPSETSGHGSGGFKCVTNITSGQIAGCSAGEGVRWDTVQLLESAGFKCGGVANEQGKTATTSSDVIVLQADFYRAGNGEDASFTAKMFVSNRDLAPDVQGMQNIWIQGFGCGTGVLNFSR